MKKNTSSDFLNNLDLSDNIYNFKFVKLEDPKFYKSFTKLISIRLPLSMIESVKQISKILKISYQKKIKEYIKEGLEKDRQILTSLNISKKYISSENNEEYLYLQTKFGSSYQLINSNRTQYAPIISSPSLKSFTLSS